MSNDDYEDPDYHDTYNIYNRPTKIDILHIVASTSICLTHSINIVRESKSKLLIRNKKNYIVSSIL